MRDVEQVIAGLKSETIREITKENARPEAQLAWYWTYIGSLDMAQQLGLINGARRQALYREVGQFKPAYEIKAIQEVKPNHLAAAEMSVEGNYNQIDGIINNEPPPKPSVLDALSQCRQDAAKGHDTPKKPPRGQEVER